MCCACPFMPMAGVAVRLRRSSGPSSLPVPSIFQSLPLGLLLGAGVPGVGGGMKACVVLVTAAAAAKKRTEEAQDGIGEVVVVVA